IRSCGRNRPNHGGTSAAPGREELVELRLEPVEVATGRVLVLVVELHDDRASGVDLRALHLRDRARALAPYRGLHVAAPQPAVRRIFSGTLQLPNSPIRSHNVDAITTTTPSSSSGGVSLSRDRGTPVDREDLTGDMARRVGKQEAGDVRDVLGLRDAPERDG